MAQVVQYVGCSNTFGQLENKELKNNKIITIYIPEWDVPAPISGSCYSINSLAYCITCADWEMYLAEQQIRIDSEECRGVMNAKINPEDRPEIPGKVRVEY